MDGAIREIPTQTDGPYKVPRMPDSRLLSVGSGILFVFVTLPVFLGMDSRIFCGFHADSLLIIILIRRFRYLDPPLWVADPPF